MVRTVDITRYATPLREGSSLPALVEADDGREYVVKFRGAGTTEDPAETFEHVFGVMVSRASAR